VISFFKFVPLSFLVEDSLLKPFSIGTYFSESGYFWLDKYPPKRYLTHQVGTKAPSGEEVRTTQIMPKRQNRKSEYTLKPYQVKKVFAALYNLRDRCLVKSFYFAGLRLMEAAKLDVRDINFDRRWLHVREGKLGKSQTIVILDDEFLSDLRILIGERKSGPVFVGPNGEALSLRAINKIMQKETKLSGLENPDPLGIYLNPHLFRHSYSRWLKDQGFSVEWIQNFLGHESFRTTYDEYGRMGLDEAEAEAQRRGFRETEE